MGEMRADGHGWNEAVGVKLLITLASWPHRSEEATASHRLLPCYRSDQQFQVVLYQLSAGAGGRWWAVPACTMIWNNIEAVKVGPGRVQDCLGRTCPIVERREANPPSLIWTRMARGRRKDHASFLLASAMAWSVGKVGLNPGNR
jgi:hypothetical protein